MPAGTWRPTSIASWPAPLGMPQCCRALGGGRLLEHVDELGRERQRLEPVGLAELELEALLARRSGRASRATSGSSVA